MQKRNYLGCIILIVMVVSILGIIGCSSGGGSSSGDTAISESEDTAISESFSPVTARNAQGDKAKLYWKYRVNEGKSLVVEDDDITLNLNFNDLTLTIDPDDLRRSGSLSGNITGDASGSFDVEVYESITLDGETTLINNQDIGFEMSISAEGETIKFEFDTLMNFDVPIEWFPDRKDLNELGLGYVYDEQGSVSGTLNVSLYWNYDGEEDSDQMTIPDLMSSERWEIVGFQDSIVVMGKEYRNIVILERQTLIPNIYDYYGYEETTIKYWVAQGIGTIKSIGEFNLLGQSLTIELIETNLEQP